MKRLISISLRLIISGVLLFLLFREHDLIAEIVPRFREMQTNWPWVAGGLVFIFLSLLLTAIRWHILLRGLAPELPFAVVMRAELVSAFFNISSLGVVGGDAYKIMSISRRLPGKGMPVGVSLVIDHLTGLVAVALLFGVCIATKSAQWPEFGPNVRMLVTGYSIYVGGALVGFLLSWFSLRPDVLAWGRRTFRRTFGLPKFESFIGRVAGMYDILTPLWRRALAATGVSIGMHLAFFMSFYCGLRAVGGAAPVLDVLTAMPIVDAAASLPVSVSGLGVRERTFEALLAGIAGVPDAVGVSASLAGWLFSLCWGLFGGLLFLRSRAAEPAPKGGGPDMKKAPRIAISLGASFMGYATHAGFMARLHALGVRPAAIAGSSAGAITAGLYAAGLGQEAIRDAVLSPRLYLSFAKGTRWVWHQFVRAHQDVHPGFLDAQSAVRHFESFVGQRDIKSLTNPRLVIALSDLQNAETVFASHGPLATAMAASACVPMMFSAIEFDGRMCTDGGVSHETPVDPWFTDDEVDHIIIHRIDQPPGRPPFMLHGRLIATMFASRESMGRQIMADRLRLAEIHGKRVTTITTVHSRPSPLYPRGLKDCYAMGEATAQKLYDEHLAALS